MTNVIVCNLCTSWQVANREAVLDAVAGLSVTPTLQAGVFLLRRIQHVVTAQALRKEQSREIFNNDVGIRGSVFFSCKWWSAAVTGSLETVCKSLSLFALLCLLRIILPLDSLEVSFPVMANRLFRQFSRSEKTG